MTGTSKYVTGYTEWSPGNVEWQEGNFLALHFDAPGATKISVELVGGHKGPVDLDADGLVVFRIESNEQYIRAVADYGARGAVIGEWSLDDLTLTPQG
ncbi:MAG: hypothetical protein IKH78_08045 [Ruminococcus sp.]|nr:hypothetical protein [Ruminococcus sp.]